MSESRVQLVLLGTGTPNAEPDRSGPAVAIVVGEDAYLIDAGPGVVRQAAAAHREGHAALDPARLSRVFLTHLHSDHTVGLPDLLLTPWVLGRDIGLEIFGPPGTAQLVEGLTQAYRADIEERLGGLEPIGESGWRASVYEVEAGRVYADRSVYVDALAVRHGRQPALAYKFTHPQRTIVISGDTAPHPPLEAFAESCDLLVHEVYSTAGFASRDETWQQYHRAMHTSSAEVGKLAAQAQPGALVLYHQLYWGATDEELLGEVRLHYPGEVHSGKDLQVY